MNEVVAEYPNRKIEVILDNLNTHKKNDAWLKRHPSVTFHYTGFLAQPGRGLVLDPAGPITGGRVIHLRLSN
jgi:hypothetical protein